MKKLNTLFVCAAMTLGASAALANPPAYTPPQPPGAEQSVDVSDQKLDKFAEIYIDVETTRSELATELSSVEDPQRAQEIQMRMRDEIIATIEDHGWSLEEYNRFAQLIASDEELKTRAIEKINGQSS